MDSNPIRFNVSSMTDKYDASGSSKETQKISKKKTPQQIIFAAQEKRVKADAAAKEQILAIEILLGRFFLDSIRKYNNINDLTELIKRLEYFLSEEEYCKVVTYLMSIDYSFSSEQ